MADVKLDVEFDEAGLKKSGKRLQAKLEKMEQRLSRKRARNRLKKKRAEDKLEKEITRNEMREQIKRERMEKRLSRKRARNRLKQIKATIREEKRIEREAERERERKKDRRRAIAGGAVRGAGRAVGFGLGAIGATTAALFDAEQVLEFGRSLAILSGQAGISVEAQAKLSDALTDVSIKTGVTRTDVLAGFEAIIEKTGDLKLAEDVILSMAKASAGLGADMRDLGLLAAGLGTSFNASGEEAIKFFELLTAQGDKGQVTLKDLARIGQDVFSRAKAFGVVGAEGVSGVGALLQTTPLASSDEIKTAVGSLLEVFGTEGSKIRKEFKVKTKTKSGDLRNPADILKDIVSATGGDLEKIKKVFKGTALTPFLTTAKQFEKTKGFADLDKFLGLGSGAEGLVQKRFSRIEATAGVIALEKFQNVITGFSDSALAPALTELSGSLTALLQDKEKVEALTELFKTLGEGLGFLIEAAAFAGEGIGFFSKTSKEVEKKTGIKPVNPFSPSFGVEAIKKAKDFFGDDNKVPKGSTLPKSKQGGLNVEVNATIDDRGNVKKQRTRVSNQNNPNVGRTLTGAGR